MTPRWSEDNEFLLVICFEERLEIDVESAQCSLGSLMGEPNHKPLRCPGLFNVRENDYTYYTSYTSPWQTLLLIIYAFPTMSEGFRSYI